MTTRMTRTLAAAAGVTLLLGAAACNNDGMTSINRDPNEPENVPATTLFTNATRTAVGRWLGAGIDLRGTEFVAQHLAEVQYPEEDRYARLTGGSTTGYFDAAYVNELEDFQKVIQKGMSESAPGLYAPAMTMRTWVFGDLTDVWGDIPYFQALQGDSADGSIAPAYDPQQAIYADFFQVLDKATTDLAGAENALGDADPIYGGDPTAWQKFSNSLRARFALRLVNVDPTTASQELQAALAAPGGVIASNSDNAILRWPGDGIYNNPWADNFKTRDDHRMSQTLMNIMLANNDPRIPIYAQPTVADPTKYAGMPNALTHTAAQAYFNTSSRPGAVFYPGATAYGTFGGSGASFPSFLMTAAEVLFIQAEAAERGLGGLSPGQAQGFYESAIRASMEQWGATDEAAISAFLASPNVAYQGGTAGLKQIAVQKWIALYTDGIQAWTEWRRTCQPSTIRPGPNAITNEVPRRFQYSTTEYSVNKTSVDAAISQMGPDEFSTRMYWDTQPTAAPTYESGCGVRS